MRRLLGFAALSANLQDSVAHVDRAVLLVMSSQSIGTSGCILSHQASAIGVNPDYQQMEVVIPNYRIFILGQE